LIAIAKHEQLLSRLGLTTVEQVKAYKGEHVKGIPGERRDVVRITTTDGDGRKLVLFLKRNWCSHKKDGLLSLLRRGRVCSIARHEWENSAALERAGLRAAERVAYGEECGPLWERFSFIITEAATGSQTVQHFIRTCRDRGLRRRLFTALARFTRRLHDAGLASPDLFTRHIYADLAGDEPQFCLIDMPRLDQRRTVSLRLRVRDLAALNVTAPLRSVSRTDRMRFLKDYAGSSDRRLARLILRRSDRLVARRKFLEFKE
jgi:hypothetical protein